MCSRNIPSVQLAQNAQWCEYIFFRSSFYQFDISSIGVLILAAFANTKRLHKLSAVDQFVMMYGGLRGAVAFALVLLIDKKVIH